MQFKSYINYTKLKKCSLSEPENVFNLEITRAANAELATCEQKKKNKLERTYLTIKRVAPAGIWQCYSQYPSNYNWYEVC
jgi:hypothetical protein